jgi:hypothetical protein
LIRLFLAAALLLHRVTRNRLAIFARDQNAPISRREYATDGRPRI